jgi:DNA repair protein RadC
MQASDRPSDDRPRERLGQQGAQALSDAEVVALLLRTGCRGLSALELARDLLASCDGVGGLLRTDGRQWRRRGLGSAKLATLLASVELARRLARSSLPERPLLDQAEATARYLGLKYQRDDQEIMGALYLDVRHRLVGEREIYRGTLLRAAVEPRGILKEGLLLGAAGVLVFHTHPSGDPAPSVEDLAFTRRLAEAAEILGMKLLDHLILGGPVRWVSLRERGAW